MAHDNEKLYINFLEHATELYRLYNVYISVGFTSEQAWELVKIAAEKLT